MSPGYDVLLPGCYFCDLIFTGLPGMPQLGAEIFGTDFDMVPGASFTTALALHRLGLRVGWACDFGSDFFSRFVLEAAHAAGIDSHLFRVHNQPMRCVTASLSFPHDRAFVSFMDEQPPLNVAALIEQHRPRAVLLSGLNMGPPLVELVAAARRHGTFVYMDCQCVAATLETPGVAEALRLVDVFAPNATEAMHLTGTSSVPEALAILAELAPLVVVKSGPDGAVARSGDRIVRAPAIPVQVFDTTGAGDCFNAGFLFGHLRGESLEICLRCGNVCGGLKTTARGGAGLPTADVMEQWLR